jgi:hypothetical protein
VNDPAPAPVRTMRLRYAGKCRVCGRSLPAGTTARYERVTRTVRCLQCPLDVDAPGVFAAAPEVTSLGRPGASARRRYEQLRERRERRVRTRHPVLGGLLLALTSDPQSTRAWGTGAIGEEILGRRLSAASGPTLRPLHDLRIPGTRANIDHVVVCPNGVLVIDAKNYRGRPSLRIQGGLFTPRTEMLLVGRRDCTKLVESVQRQVDRVSGVLQAAGMSAVPVSGMLCFVDSDWPLHHGAFSVRGVQVLWPRRAVELAHNGGPLGVDDIATLHRLLARAFPPR